MAAALPHLVQLKLEQTLAQWRQWRDDPPLSQPPQVVAVLGQGLSNFSVLVAAEKAWVVRIDGVNPVALGLNRQAEWRALGSACKRNLAPTPRYFNPELGSLVCDYLPPGDDAQAAGEPAAGSPTATEITDTANLLRAIHGLPALHHRLDLRERLLRYERQLQLRSQELPAELAECRQDLMAILAQIESRPQPRALCHNDLLAANRLYSGGRLWAIDWEYCAMGNPWFDLAVVAAGDDLDGEQRTSLLREYLQRDPTGGDKLELQQHGCLYRYLELLWYAALDRQGADDKSLELRLAILGEKLAISP